MTRKIGEGIAIGDDVKVIIMQIKGKQVRIGIKASPTTIVHREEIYQKIQEENRTAASPDTTNIQEVEALFSKTKDDKTAEPKRTPLRRQIRIPKQD